MPENSIIGGGDGANNAVAGEQQINAENNQTQTNSENKPAATGNFDYATMIGENGALAENWREGLPEGIRGERCLDNIKTIGTLAQSYVHAQKSIGANRITIPGENAGKEELDAYYKAIGRPDNAEGYSVDKITLPEGITLDDDMLKDFRQYAHNHGMSQKMFQAALEYDVQRAAAAATARKQAEDKEFDDTNAKLREEFGATLPQVIAKCNKALDTFGLTEVLREHRLLNNYTLIKALASIGDKISESRLHDSDLPPSGNDPQARLDDIMGDRKDPYYDREHPGHKARVAEVQGLLQAISNSKKK